MTDPAKKSSQTDPPGGVGHVWLVGAGPGDPGLITVAGLEALRQADAVVYDALANPRLLAEAPDNCELIDAGKRAKAHRLTQDQTNALLADLARQGKRVVRLKGGDPYLFGRGAEEAAHLARQGVAVTVVPGVTSGIAAPMYAGIPVTHRDHASTVTFVTAHEDPGKDRSAVDYAALARLIAAGGTACFYMGVGWGKRVALGGIRHNKPGAMPAAVVRWGTMPQQRTVRATLGGIADAVAAAGLTAPAIIVVGQVAGLEEPGLRFYEDRPLFGRTVLVTRTRSQASALLAHLEAAGARVIEAPTIEIEPAASMLELDNALAGLAEVDWLVLTSVNAVAVLAGRVRDARALVGVRIAVVGPATADALRDHLRIEADFVPQTSNGGALARSLIASFDMQGARCLLLRGDLAGDGLPAALAEAGATVRQVTVYQTRRADALPAEALDALRAGQVDWAAFASSSAVHNLVALLGDEAAVLAGVRCAAIGPVTAAAITELGLHVAAQAPAADVAALAAAIVDADVTEVRDG